MKKVYSFVFATLLFASCAQEKAVKVTVSNPLETSRTEIVELSWDDVKGKLSLAEGQSIIVLDKMGQQVAYQVIDKEQLGAPQLIFQTSLDGKGEAAYTIKVGQPETFETQVQTTFMPRRKDDISWENDRVSYRMYGPALEVDPKELLVSGAIDIWCKKTPKLVTQQWYQDEFDGVKSYHEDHGEGLDFYKSGKTLGAGAAAPYADGNLFYISHNFKTYDIIENGPLRTVFQLTFEPYYAPDSVLVNETRTITLDAGSNLNKIVENYGEGSPSMQLAAGFPYYKNENYVSNNEQGYLSYGQPAHAKHGVIYLGVVSANPFVEVTEAQDQMLAIMNYKGGSDFTYYSGGGWSKGGFPTQGDWDNYVIDFSKRLRNPLTVVVE